MQVDVTLDDRAGKVPALEYRAMSGPATELTALPSRGQVTGIGGGHVAGSGGVAPMVIPPDTLPA